MAKSLRAAQFLDKLKLEHVDGCHWLVDEPLRFYSAKNHRTFKVAAGTKTDLASVPRFFWRLFPSSGKYNRAAVIHDAGYNNCLIDVNGYDLIVDKKVADDLFLEAMIADGVSGFRAKIMHFAVKIFGRKSKRHARRNRRSD